MKKCKCGLCEELPVLYRGEYKDYALWHNRTDWYIKRYIELFGEPKCIVCGNISGFRRKVPRKYCSKKCSGKINGFSKSSTQEKIKSVVREKYKVDNVSKIPKVRKKISKSKIGITFKMSDEGRKNVSNSIKKKWLNPQYKKRTSLSIKKSLNTSEQRKKRSLLMKDRWNCENGRNDLLDKLLKGLKNRLSKLHQKIKNELQLDKIGFVSEQRVDRYLVDELNENKKIIIEINGDYIHANPKIYKLDDIIRLPGNSYTAQEKWDNDKVRKENLEKLGYKVITIWESDDLNEHKVKINNIIV